MENLGNLPGSENLGCATCSNGKFYIPNLKLQYEAWWTSCCGTFNGNIHECIIQDPTDKLILVTKPGPTCIYKCTTAKLLTRPALYFGFLTGACMLLVGHESAHAVRARRTDDNTRDRIRIYGAAKSYVRAGACICHLIATAQHTYKIFNSCTYSLRVPSYKPMHECIYACMLARSVHMHVRHGAWWRI